MPEAPTRWPRAVPRLEPRHTNLALALLGLATIFLTVLLVREHTHYWIGFSGVAGWSVLVYAAACALVLTQPTNRWTLCLILAVAIASRVIALVPPPFLSSDIYRYVWDGIVQHAGISPYRYVPGNPALTSLRAPHQAIFDHINRRDYAPTIYPPFAQMIFFLATWISPTVRFMKIVMVAFEGVTVWALLRILRELGRKPEQVLLYAWCPMLLWEIGVAGHIDSAAMAFIALTLLARLRRQPILTGLWIGIAILIKFYPAFLLPALWWWRDSQRWPAGRGSAWKLLAAIFGVIAFGYACYLSAGRLVFGFATGYAKEEGIETGVRYFLLELAHRIPGLGSIPVWAYFVFCAVVFAALKLWTWHRAWLPGTPRDAFLAPALAFAMALMLLFSPHYPWYILWLVPLFTLCPNPAAFVYIMGIFYGFTTRWAIPGPRMFLLNEWLYGATALVFVIWLILQRRKESQPA